MSMSDPRVTIVIPTYKRHHLLGKALAHYDAFGLPVLVVDSTPTPFTGLAGLRNVEYLHRPDEPMPHKLRAPVCDRVNTPYMVMSADDSFTSLAGIDACVEFLEANPALGISWPLPAAGLSERDRAHPLVSQGFVPLEIP